MAINKNINDDITLAYLLKKTEEKAKRMVNAAMETINTFINGCHIYSLPSQLGLTGTPTMRAVSEAMPNYSIGIFNASDIDQSALTALPYGEINNIYIVRHNSYRMFALGVRAYNGVSFDGLRLAVAGYNHTDWVGWKEVILPNSTALTGKVDKAGDTMTGNLTVKDAAMAVQDTRITSSVAPSSDIYGRSYYMNDSVGFNVATLQMVALANGNTGFQLVAGKKVNNVNKFNYMRLYVKSDGNPFVELSNPAAWRDALNAVNKAGDTMSGTLSVSNTSPAFVPKNTAMDVTSASYSETVSSSGLLFRDKNDQNVAWYTDRYESDGSTGILIGACKRISNANTWHYLRIMVAKDGTKVVLVTEPAAWRKALGLGNANGAFPLTIAQGGSGQTAITYVNTASSIITAGTGITISSAEYVQWGKIAQLRVKWKSSSTISVTADGNCTNVTIGTIASGKRPKIESAGTSQGDEGGPAFYSLSTAGTLQLGACGGTGASRTIAANTAFTAYLTYILP